MGKDKSTGKSRGGIENLIPFKPGESGNPKGYPKGKKNFRTLMREAIEKIAAANNKTVDELDMEVFQMGFKRARSGDYKFYQDYMDRLHDKPVQKHDVDVDVKMTIDEEKRIKSISIIQRLGDKRSNRDPR